MNKLCSEVLKFKKNQPITFLFVSTYLLSILFYVVIYSLYTLFSEGNKSLMSLNELGDFLAGSFAPLAFLFLYLGYKQQGEELKQNTEALHLQAKELKNSVEQQQALVDITKAELEELKNQFLQQNKKELIQRQPTLHFNKVKIYRSVKDEIFNPDVNFSLRSDDEFNLLSVSFSLLNSRSIVRNVRLIFYANHEPVFLDQFINILDRQNSINLRFEIPYPNLFIDNHNCEIEFYFNYLDEIDDNHIQKYKFNIYRDTNDFTFNHNFQLFDKSY